MNQLNKPAALVVEDDELQRELICALLEESDMRVFDYESAEAAEAKLDTAGLVLVFTDVNLAGSMTGAELAAIAKRRFPKLAVIVTSGLDKPALPAGALFMPKPWRALDILREAEKFTLSRASAVRWSGENS